jgi:hypothetical protein
MLSRVRYSWFSSSILQLFNATVSSSHNISLVLGKKGLIQYRLLLFQLFLQSRPTKHIKLK